MEGIKSRRVKTGQQNVIHSDHSANLKHIIQLSLALHIIQSVKKNDHQSSMRLYYVDIII